MTLALDWVRSNQTLLWWIGGISAALFVVTLAVIPLLVVRMDRDYFVRQSPPPDSWRGQHPAIRLTVLVLQNIVGAIFVLAGIAMLVGPGQGLLSILIGLGLLNFRGKKQLQLRIVRQRPVMTALNWIRARAGRPPLRLPLRRRRKRRGKLGKRDRRRRE